jgi:hypothetical protein
MVAEGTLNESELPVWPETVVGGKFVRLLEKQVDQLRDEEPHGNRKLFLDDVFVVYLLAFFNPTVRSLRTIEDFSQTRQVQKHLSIPKLCKSTLSEFQKLADPERLQPVITALRAQLEAKGRTKVQDAAGAKGLAELLQKTVAVDGTLLPAMADVAWAIRSTNKGKGDRLKARLDCQLSVESWLPEAIVVPEPEQSESDVAQQLIQPGKIYLYDRGYSAYSLINAHYEEAGDEYQAIAHYVIRYRPAGGNSPQLREATERELTDKDRAAGVISDRVGRFISSKNSRHHILNVPIREVIVQYEQDGELKTVRLITNLLDVPAAVIAQLYRYRWQVELFFRWLKSYGKFGHLISHSRSGVLTHFYVTIIGVLLMYLHTGFRPSKYLFVLMSQVASGAASLEEVLPILRERERQSELARQSQARRRAKKQG